jgi:hypothetical protein
MTGVGAFSAELFVNDPIPTEGGPVPSNEKGQALREEIPEKSRLPSWQFPVAQHVICINFRAREPLSIAHCHLAANFELSALNSFKIFRGKRQLSR